MRAKPASQKAPADRIVKGIRRGTPTQHTAEDKIRIVLCASS
jgi:hypothetical protein